MIYACDICKAIQSNAKEFLNSKQVEQNVTHIMVQARNGGIVSNPSIHCVVSIAY